MTNDEVRHTENKSMTRLMKAQPQMSHPSTINKSYFGNVEKDIANITSKNNAKPPLRPYRIQHITLQEKRSMNDL